MLAKNVDRERKERQLISDRDRSFCLRDRRMDENLITE